MTKRHSLLLLVRRQMNLKVSSASQVGRVTPCAPFGKSAVSGGAHRVTRPTQLRNLFVTVLASLGLAGLSLAADADHFAVVQGDRLNVRAQPSLYSEVILQLNVGDRVQVLEEITADDPGPEEPAKWTRIAMPTNATVWVSSLFVDAERMTVRARRLNVRAGPGENYSVVGRVERGATLKQLKAQGNWIEVEPPPGCFAFVASEFLVPAKEPTPPAESTPPTTPPPQPEPEKTEPAPPPAQPEDQPGKVAPAVPPLSAEPLPAIEAEPRSTATVSEPAESAHADAPESTRLPPPENIAKTKPAEDVLTEHAPRTTQQTLTEDTSSREPVTFRVATKRTVRREGIVRRTVSIQAPSDFGLHSTDTGALIDYIYSDSPDLDLKAYHGSKVLVTGVEGMDPRWQRTPVLEVQTIRILP